MDFQKLIGALPNAATSSYALVAYVALVSASLAIAWRVKRNKNLLDALEKIPPEQRSDLVKAELGEPVPPGLTAEQWIIYKIHKYYFMAFIAFLICASVVLVVALSKPDQSGPKWYSSEALSHLKVGTSKEYLRSVLGAPPISKSFSAQLDIAGDFTYERYSSDSVELQIIYESSQMVAYVIRLLGTPEFDVVIPEGEHDWLLGKNKFSDAGEAPSYASDNFFWGKSICQLEQHYYGAAGSYNFFYYALNDPDSEKAPSRINSPNAIMVSRDICTGIDNEDDEDECNKTLRGMVCTTAADFEG